MVMVFPIVTVCSQLFHLVFLQFRGAPLFFLAKNYYGIREYRQVP